MSPDTQIIILICMSIILFIILFVYIVRFNNLRHRLKSLSNDHQVSLLEQRIKVTETLHDEQKNLLHSILNNIPMSIHIKDVDDDFKHIFWNKESLKICGESLFTDTENVMPEEQLREINRIDKIVFDTEIPYSNNEILVINGVSHNMNVHKSVIYDGDRKLLLVFRWDVGLKNELHRKSKILSISMNTLHAFTWYCDLRDNIIHFGDEFNVICNNPKELDTIHKFVKRIHAKDQDNFMEVFNNAIKQEKGEFIVEYEVDLKGDKNYQWWECRGVVEDINIDGVSYRCLYGMDINIDAHKQSELDLLKNKQELDELNKQNELILNNSNSGLVFLNNDYNIEWENLSTFMPNHPITAGYRKGAYCYQIRGLSEPCEGCVVVRSLSTGKIEVKEIEYNDTIGELTATPVFDDENCRIGTVLKVVDITEKKKTSVKLETANILLRNIIDCLPCLIFMKDVNDDYRHIMINNYFADTVGISEEDIVGKTDYDIFPNKETADKCRRDDNIAVNGDDLFVYEEETNFNGKRIIWQTTKTTIKTIDGKHLLIGVASDITSKIIAYEELQEAKERAEQSNMLKSAFLANMSHEIRTPLNAIVGFSELMVDADREEQIEYSKIINTNNELLLRLISDILDLSKIEAGILDLKPVEFDVVEVMNNLAIMFAQRIDSTKINFVFECSYDRCLVFLDKNRFTQVLTNFIVNAIKFTTEGEIRMGYEYVNGGLKIFVSDTGIGIAEDKVAKVFERFEKLNDFAQGTGLGMAISKAIMEAHGGTIGVDSEEGVGSTFWAWSPISAIVKM